MICEKCSSNHDGSYGSGRFCSSKCARGFSANKVNNEELKRAQCPKCKRRHKIKKRASPKFTLCSNCKEPEKPGLRIFGDSTKQCLCCGNTLNRTSKCFCSQTCHAEYINLIYFNKWQSGIDDGVVGKGSTNIHIKRYFVSKYDNKCQKCGWGKLNKHTGRVPVELHHIDGNFRNNKEDNLILLCPNCHSLTSTYKASNKNNTRTHR